MIDGLARRGAEVVHSGIAYVHESGHAKRGELQTLLSVARPQCFIPVHGEYRHLLAHARLAIEMGVGADSVLLCEDGDVIRLDGEGIDFDGEVPAGYLFVDGIVGDVGHGVLRDRRLLAEEGLRRGGRRRRPAQRRHHHRLPELITRGWVHAEEAEAILDESARGGHQGRRPGGRERCLGPGHAPARQCGRRRALRERADPTPAR